MEFLQYHPILEFWKFQRKGVVDNAQVVLYDNTAASGTILWDSGTMGSQTIPFDINFHSLPFSNGLTLVISAANCNVLVIYE